MPSTLTEPAPRLTHPYILVVEDDIDSRSTLMFCLQEADFKVVGAAHGLEALRVLVDAERRKHLPSLLFLDINMPVMNGWELLGFMRMCSELCHIPVCLTTAEPIPSNDTYVVL